MARSQFSPPGVSTVQSNCQHDHGRQRSRFVIIGLVIVHLVAAVTLGTCIRVFGYDDYSVVGVSFVGLAFAQAGLVGLCSALGSASWRLRLGGLISGTAYIAIGFGFAVDENDWETYSIFAFATCTTAAGLAVFRRLGSRLALVPRENEPVANLQFGIRHLLILTLLTGLTLAVVLSLDVGLSGYRFLFLLVVIALPFIAVAIVVPWAVLGERGLALRGAVLVIVAGIAAWSGYHLLREISFTWMLLAEAAILLATLLVVRLCGYRLVRLDSDQGRGSGARQNRRSPANS